MNIIAERNPMLGMIREEQRAAKEKGNMARKMGYPMLGVGLQYMVTRPAGQSMTGHTGGMDMVMPMVTVSLPIMRGKYRSAREEAAQLQRASEERYRDTYRRIEAELYRLRHLLDQATRNIQLAREQVRLVRTNLEIALSRFAAGDGSLDELLQIRRQLAGYKLNELSAIIDYNSAVAAVQQLLSTPNP